MKKDKLKHVISECCNDISFSYNNKNSGVTSEVHDYKPTFQVWHGEVTKTYTDINELMSDKFYSGKSLDELVEKIEIEII